MFLYICFIVFFITLIKENLRNTHVRVQILISFQTFLLFPKPHFQTLMHWKAHLFRHIRLFLTFFRLFLTDAHMPLRNSIAGDEYIWTVWEMQSMIAPLYIYIKTCFMILKIWLCWINHDRRSHTQERSRFPSRLKYWDILRLFRQAEIISLIAERDDSGHRTAHAWYQALPLFWYARLEWWDRKYQDYLLERSHIRRDANNRANSHIIVLIPK